MTSCNLHSGLLFCFALNNAFLLGRGTGDGVSCFFVLLFVSSEIKSLLSQSVGIRQILCSSKSLKAVLSSPDSSLFSYCGFTLDLILPCHLCSSLVHFLLLSQAFLENHQPLPRSFLQVLLFSGSILLPVLWIGATIVST